MKIGDFVRVLDIAPQHVAFARNQIVELEGDLARLRFFSFFVPIAQLKLTEPTEAERKFCERYKLPVAN